mmetsp:Transcript_18364/g.54803  ORF Transcript_18364/g.54803 Transcript_18364/m.54803 type:complete len:209 (+) Transcript_18364:1398-2024(+)
MRAHVVSVVVARARPHELKLLPQRLGREVLRVGVLHPRHCKQVAQAGAQVHVRRRLRRVRAGRRRRRWPRWAVRPPRRLKPVGRCHPEHRDVLFQQALKHAAALAGLDVQHHLAEAAGDALGADRGMQLVSKQERARGHAKHARRPMVAVEDEHTVVGPARDDLAAALPCHGAGVCGEHCQEGLRRDRAPAVVDGQAGVVVGAAGAVE